ncbi:interleukin-37 isoform X1 [Cynocephalus volans]|uniref:interleukin-37 isoform X1 n=1 Tax=Cynocephalus volans TaxID=110931 RepID=UPI002FCBF589
MSLLEENSRVNMDSEDGGKEEAQGCSEDPAGSPLEPGPRLPSVSSAHSETFFVLALHVRSAHQEKGSPIHLAVSKGELCLCCDKEKGKSQPSLQLKKKKLTNLTVQKEPALQRFIFYRSKVGSLNTLESAAHPGWFICTSCEAGEPVGVTDNVGKRKHTEFVFRKVCKAAVSPSEVSE